MVIGPSLTKLIRSLPRGYGRPGAFVRHLLMRTLLVIITSLTNVIWFLFEKSSVPRTKNERISYLSLMFYLLRGRIRNISLLVKYAYNFINSIFSIRETLCAEFYTNIKVQIHLFTNTQLSILSFNLKQTKVGDSNEQSHSLSQKNLQLAKLYQNIFLCHTLLTAFSL